VSSCLTAHQHNTGYSVPLLLADISHSVVCVPNVSSLYQQLAKLDSSNIVLIVASFDFNLP